MPRLIIAALTALPALLLAGCDSVFSAEVETERVCISHDDVTFPGADASGGFTYEVTYDLGEDLPLVESGADYELELQQLEVALDEASGITDLGGVETLTVTVLPPDEDLQERVVAEYQRTEPSPTRIVAEGNTGVELSPYIEAGQLRLRIRAEGALPEDPWTAQVRACFSLTADFDYLDHL